MPTNPELTVPLDAPSAPVGRPRDPDIDRAVLAATIELLAQHGYAGLTIEKVAQRAGVHKPAVYRRWANKADLAIAAVQSFAPATEEPRTGDVRSDLIALLVESTAAAKNKPRADVLLRFRAEIRLDAELAAAVDRNVVAPRRATSHAVFDRAIGTGEIRADVDVDLVIDMLFGPVQARSLADKPPLKRREIEQIVDVVLDGIRVDGVPTDGT